MRGSISGCDDPKPRTPRSLSGQLVDLDELDLRQREHHELRDAHARLDDERLARDRCSAVRPAARRGSRSRSSPGVLTIEIPCFAARPERGWTKPA